MSRCCRGICERYPKLAPNYKDGKKCCRHCGLFLVSTESLCPCCKSPLACKGRANRTQLLRRMQKIHQSSLTVIENAISVSWEIT